MTETGRGYPSEAFGYLRRAEQLFGFWNVASRLKIEGVEKALALKFVTERLLRAGIYESSATLNSPHAVLASRFKFGAKRLEQLDLRDTNTRRAQDQLNQEINQTLAAKFPNPDDRIRARTIELAVNDLIARATPNTLQNGGTGDLSLPREDLDAWQARWQPQLQRAEQKHSP